MKSMLFALLTAVTLLFSTGNTLPEAVANAPITQQEDGQAKVVINAPEKVKIGDLIIIDLSGSQGGGFDYEVMPQPPGLQIFNDGKTIVCGTGDKNVEYMFVVSCAKDGDSDIAMHKIQVYGAAPETPAEPGSDLDAKIMQWVDLVDSPSKRDDCLKLAQSFSSIATITEQDSFGSLGEMMTALATSNRDALNGNLELWSPFLDGLAQELKAMSGAGSISDMGSHAVVWREIAQGLREYATSLN